MMTIARCVMMWKGEADVLGFGKGYQERGGRKEEKGMGISVKKIYW